MTTDPPVFVCCRDRVSDLRRLVEWFERAGHERITLLDNASTWGPLLDYYEQSPHEVVRLKENLGARAIWDAGLAPSDEHFVYSDPDVLPVEECPLDAVAYLAELLDRHGRAPKVALGIYLDDAPVDVRLERALVGPSVDQWEPGVFATISDTTLALWRRGAGFEYGALRTSFPYQLRHRPWYLDPGALDEENRHYLARAKHGPTGSMWATEAPARRPGDA